MRSSRANEEFRDCFRLISFVERCQQTILTQSGQSGSKRGARAFEIALKL